MKTAAARPPFVLHFFEQLDSLFNSLQNFFPPDDLHALEERRADLLPGDGRAQDAEDLVGAQTGLLGIPRRFLEGLHESDKLQRLAMDVAARVGDTVTGADGGP
mgnify:CR=1 FL=1